MVASWWRDLPAARWSYRLAVTQALLLALWAVLDFLVTLVTGAFWLAMFPALLAALWGWVAHAWAWERRWAWWVLTVVAAVGVAGDLVELPLRAPGLRTVVDLLINAVILALLLHADSRARIRPRQPHAPSEAGREPSGGATHPPGDWPPVVG